MLLRLEKFIFFLLIFFISSQVGLHFWPEFSYVNGVRIDYLSPTLYILDILVLLLFVLFAIRTKFNVTRLLRFVRNDKLFKILFLLLLTSLLWNSFYASSPAAHIYGITKIAQFGFLGIYIAYVFKKDFIRPFVDVLALSAIVSGVLALWQFINQESVGGLWYYFGERTFNITSIGISTVILNEQILRPYAAFPHPNVLAFFLFMAIVFITFRLPFAEKLQHKLYLLTALGVSTLALFTTFSRVAIILIIIFSFYEIYSKRNTNLGKISLVFLVSTILLGFVAFFPYIQTFLLRGIDLRSELFSQALYMLSQNLLFGIGLNNFFVHQVELVKNITPILFQPPHNIFLISIISLGFLGWWIFLYVLFQAFKKLKDELRIPNKEIKSFKKSVFICLVGVLFAGFFDHYFLTLEQGQLIFAIIVGLSFTRPGPEPFKKRKSQSR